MAERLDIMNRITRTNDGERDDVVGGECATALAAQAYVPIAAAQRVELWLRPYAAGSQSIGSAFVLGYTRAIAVLARLGATSEAFRLRGEHGQWLPLFALSAGLATIGNDGPRPRLLGWFTGANAGGAQRALDSLDAAAVKFSCMFYRDSLEIRFEHRQPRTPGRRLRTGELHIDAMHAKQHRANSLLDTERSCDFAHRPALCIGCHHVEMRLRRQQGGGTNSVVDRLRDGYKLPCLTPGKTLGCQVRQIAHVVEAQFPFGHEGKFSSAGGARHVR